METQEFFDLLTVECTHCDKQGRTTAAGYGDSWSYVPCYICKGTKLMPSEVGRELLAFVKRYK